MNTRCRKGSKEKQIIGTNIRLGDFDVWKNSNLNYCRIKGRRYKKRR